MNPNIFEKKLLKKDEAIEVFAYFLEARRKTFFAKRVRSDKNLFWINFKEEIKKTGFRTFEKNEIDVLSPIIAKEFNYSPALKLWKTDGFLFKVGEYERYEVDSYICYQKENYLIFYNPKKEIVSFLNFVHDFYPEQNLLFPFSIQNITLSFIKNINAWVSNFI